jgi:hypothetical protein
MHCELHTCILKKKIYSTGRASLFCLQVTNDGFSCEMRQSAENEALHIPSTSFPLESKANSSTCKYYNTHFRKLRLA